MLDKDHAIDVLNKTKERLFEKGWHQGGYGDPGGATCLAGAYQMVEVGSFYKVNSFACELSGYLNDVIVNTTPFATVAEFNDAWNTKFDDVVALIDISIKRLESE